MEEKVDAILRILTGEPLNKEDQGILGEVKNLKDSVTKLRNWKERTVAWGLGVGIGGGALGNLLLYLILKK